LHIHERVAPEAIIRAAQREDAQRSLFADPEMDFSKEIQFYQHEVNWSNRMILGDSLQVMTSLLEREGMRGKVQMIYLDPPYGIKFGSNFQPRIDRRDVKDGADDDLTREVEQVQAFRDTWELGVHSYLSYLRDRLIISRELLADSGSVFVQIGDENVHRVRCLLDEVFGEENFAGMIVVSKTSGLGARYLQLTYDFLIWFAKDKQSLKYRQLHVPKEAVSSFQTHYDELPDGRIGRLDNLTGQQNNVASCNFEYDFQGATYRNPSGRQWKTTRVGIDRLARAGRIASSGRALNYLRLLEDFPVTDITDHWTDISGSVQSRLDPKVYVVQTGVPVLARCIQMTTDPGDLVLDPTCGSGTTAYVAEQWGRRWITCDTSRVALAIARHRLMTAAFDYYTLRHPSAGVAGGFKYKTVPHITLKSIAQSPEIDTIAEEYQPQIAEALSRLNQAAGKEWMEWEVPRDLHDLVKTSASWKPVAKELSRLKGLEFEVQHQSERVSCWSYPSDPEAEAVRKEARDLANAAQSTLEQLDRLHERVKGLEAARQTTSLEELHAAFWNLKREMQAKIDASIHKNAPQEELVDQPEKESKIVRVTGPFTVEAVPNVSEISVDMEEKIFGDDLQIQIFDPIQGELVAKNVDAYISDMTEKLRKSGVVAKGKGRLSFMSLTPLAHEIVHAEGDISVSDEAGPEALRCAVIFGPQNGSIGELLVRDGLNAARKYDAILFCGYDFTGPAQERLRIPTAGQQVFMAYIAPDTAMGDLLKDTKASQLFTMVGEPDVVVYRHGDPSLAKLVEEAASRGQKDVAKRAEALKEGEVFLELRGVDLYNPVKGEVICDSGSDVHAIFVDHDYDGKSFCICQALFPNKKDSWNKIERALKASIDADAFDALRTQVTLPFKPGERMQVKVVDTRGNAVVKTVRKEH
ncbi:MAG TPA: site-specific DNA-methyltransferase, partial [Fimbriimonadaceae bacterium]|nr:site-specific DNA-methyltransferase [Fimbriimonadaceae bacterium]